ncbi:sec-independent protein translocase protein TatC [Kibdelosporangium phytohabitans]|uniref:Sec-independent protein translocase protein TatC n=2 Tax=Kibdelosporangium phytohabitans TaxID=860235 RepID=A0A0N9HV96_9PSEU|nr:preprotein translocase subunit TatC [Kibdelosporangium phytohabitans]MBE1469858.1 sec-independent protein translocase protein TatC [Kibdelosporangium phytohabitans]
MARDPHRRESRRSRSRKHNPDGTMSLRDHLYDLRHRLTLALMFLAIGAIFGYIWWSWEIWKGGSLGNIMIAPYCELPADLRLPKDECKLIQSTPFEAFLVRLKVGLGAGAVLTSPFWLYQIWAFVAPGLYDKERKFARTFVLFASLLFVAGAFLAYYVVPQGLDVLVSFGGDQFATALRANDYFSFILVMLLIFGVSFELPLVIIMLNQTGVLSYEKLKRWRRGFFFGLFVFAAIATPGTDPFSMLALSVAMCVLFELSVQVARIHDKRKARRLAGAEEDYSNLSDDDVSPLNLQTHKDQDNQPSPTPTSPPRDDKPGYDDVT